MHYQFKYIEEVLFDKLKTTKKKHKFKDNLKEKLEEEIFELRLAVQIYKKNPTIENEEGICKEVADVYIVLIQLGRVSTESLLGEGVYQMYMGLQRDNRVWSAILYKLSRTIDRIIKGYYN